MKSFPSIFRVQKESGTEQQEGSLSFWNVMTVVCYYCVILFVLYPLSVIVEKSLMVLKSLWEAGGTEGLSSDNKYA